MPRQRPTFTDDHPVRRDLETKHGVRFIRFLGRGGFSEAWHVNIDDADVALKISNLPLDEIDGRTAKELESLDVAKAAGVRQHPHIVSYFGRWLVREYLVTRWELGDESLVEMLDQALAEGQPGLSWAELLDDRRNPPGYMLQVAKAVDDFAASGHQHRDIKPANLMRFGQYVKLADLGLARFSGASTLHTEHRLGTLGYRPPEAERGEWKPLLSDLYSLAATYLKLRTGHEPFGDVAKDVYQRQQAGDPIVDGLEDFELGPVRHGLAPDPAQRPQRGALAFFQTIRPVKPVPPPAKRFRNSLGMELALIPAGEFLMGSRESPDELVKAFPGSKRDWFVDEPAHRVRLTQPFHIAVHPVTVGQFRRFVQAASYRTEAEQDGKGGWSWTGKTWEQKPELTWRNPGFPQTDDHPVVIVSWADTEAFCTWASQQDGKSYRLPTEAEWEYACRGGSREDARFAIGDGQTLIPELANSGFKRKGTTPVGSYPANGFGLFDMHGNVWEWCQDWYGADYYAKSATDDPPGPTVGSCRVLRGGSWGGSASYCRSACRYCTDPAYRYFGIGFRLVVSLFPGHPQ